MIGHTGNHVTTQGYVLSRLFEAAGHPTLAVSRSLNRYLRLADIAATIVRRRGDFDIALIEVYSGAAFVVADVASAISRRMGYTTILVLHGGNLPVYFRRFPTWTRRVLGRAHALVAPSPYLANAGAAHGFKVSVIPNVIDLDAYLYRRRSEARPRLIWMRSFHPLYNPEMALDVAAGLRAHHPQTTLVMAGQDKGLQEGLQRRAHALGLGETVRFPGFLDQTAKAREFDAADIFLNTSRIDNMPVAIVEAGAMGLPVISTAVGGIADLLQDGLDGLLVPDGDVLAMVGAARRLIAEPDLVDRLSVNGRALSERSAWSAVRAQWEDLFARLRTIQRT